MSVRCINQRVLLVTGSVYDMPTLDRMGRAMVKEYRRIYGRDAGFPSLEDAKLLILEALRAGFDIDGVYGELEAKK